MPAKLDINRLEEAASKLRALAHPMRVAIIELLDKNKELNVTYIYEALDIEQATASHHLNILKNKGVLNSRREGKNTFYSIRPDSILQIIECLTRCENR
ncbi:MAG: helix-turn-helix transcriptional regulator [Bacteroidales bacterium]|nr:helix-turn-helix transcriptional regulator [Bacteroidales bacterium]